MSDSLIAIIPARAGSKRLTGKNMRLLAGKPVIQWTIEAALAARCFDEIIVTSDSREILSFSAQTGCLSIERPAALACDTSPTFPALLHALDSLKMEKQPSQLMLLQPTSPLRTVADIHGAITLKKETYSNSIISVCEMDHSPLWSNTLNSDLRMDSFLRPEALNKRSQDLPIYYRVNGAIYLADVEKFKELKGFFMPNSRAFVMPKERSVDIDTEIDLLFCEFILQEKAFTRSV